MAAALPFIGAGLSAYSAIKGAGQQGKAARDAEQQLAQQQAIRQAVLGRLQQGPSGAVGNPFAASYGPVLPPGALPGQQQMSPFLQRIEQVAKRGPGQSMLQRYGRP